MNNDVRGASAATVGHGEAIGEQAGCAGGRRNVVVEVVGVARVDAGAPNVDADAAERVSVAHRAVDVDLAVLGGPCGPGAHADGLAQVIAASADVEWAIETAIYLAAGESFEPAPAVAAGWTVAQRLKRLGTAGVVAECSTVVAVLGCR